MSDVLCNLLADGRALFVRMNQGEFATWLLIALLLAWFARRHQGAERRRCLLGAAAFFAFGVSDLVEIRTGAWWRPWWLAAWKTACVLGILALVVADFRSRRAKPPDQPAPP